MVRVEGIFRDLKRVAAVRGCGDYRGGFIEGVWLYGFE